MSEFSDRPLIAGSIVGVRSFKVDLLGRLTGVVHEEVFRPGENVAICAQSPMERIYADVMRSMRYPLTAFGSGQIFATPASPPVSLVKKPKHRVAQANCACGFYAYFDRGHNPHHIDGNALALIEGYGTVTVGSRGFRASKARIVALVDSVERRPWYRRPTWLAWLDIALVLLNVAWSLIGTVALAEPWCLSSLAAAAIIAGIVAANRHTERYMRPALCGTPLPEQVRRNYPGVPVYDSLDAALLDFPLTPPDPLTPESDPDFWTRSA